MDFSNLPRAESIKKREEKDMDVVNGQLRFPLFASVAVAISFFSFFLLCVLHSMRQPMQGHQGYGGIQHASGNLYLEILRGQQSLSFYYSKKLIILKAIIKKRVFKSCKIEEMGTVKIKRACLHIFFIFKSKEIYLKSILLINFLIIKKKN